MIYLDNAATSFPKPEPVYQALDQFARTALANPGRSGHRMARSDSERVLDDTRHALNMFFKGESPERWVFTLNCTDALNLAIKGSVQPGDHVITSDHEHNSVSRPLRAPRESRRHPPDARRLSHEGYLDPAEIRAALTPETKLVAITPRRQRPRHRSGRSRPSPPSSAAGRCGLFFVDVAHNRRVWYRST